MIPQSKLLLLVEDNEDDELMTIEAIRSVTRDVHIEVARDGQEALERLFGEDRSDPVRKPDLVLLDIRLPKRSGFEVLDAIRSDEETRYTPVVMLTSSDEARDVRSAYDLHANSYVRKPIPQQEFKRVVGTLGDYWTTCNEALV